jgi:hypothetical protein
VTIDTFEITARRVTPVGVPESASAPTERKQGRLRSDLPGMDQGPSRHGHFGARDGSPPQVGCADRPHPRRFGVGQPDLRIGGEASSSDRVSAVPVNTMTVWPEPALQLAGDAGATSRQGPTSGWRLRLAQRWSPSGLRRWVRRSILRDAREWRADDHTSGCERPRRAVSPSGTRATAEGWGARARTTGCRSSERALGRERVSSEMRRDDVGTPAPSGDGTDAVDLPLGADPLAFRQA